MKSTSSEILGIFKNFFNIGLFQAASMLLQLLAVPIIIRQYGLEVFGEITLSTSIAYLLANLINYGTNQTAIKQVAINKENSSALSRIFSEIFQIRILIFILIFSMLVFVQTLSINTGISLYLWLSILPILLAEIFNPLYFLLGIEKVQWISWGNVIAKCLSLILLLVVSIQQNSAIIINLFVGLPLLLLYVTFFIIAIKKYRLSIEISSIDLLKNKFIQNFFVTFNGSVVMMQQSIFLFFVAGTSSPAMLGAYGVIDKLLNATRQIVSYFSTSIYPKASILFNSGVGHWKSLRKKIQVLYTLGSVLTAIIIFIFSDQIVLLITKSNDQLTKEYIQLFALAPLFLSLNANNFLDLLLMEDYVRIFYISLCLLLATMLLSLFITSSYFQVSLGWYPVLMEAACLCIYLIFNRKLLSSSPVS
jgi:O-antigen/teichoic acid export membrane protein